MTDVLIFLLCQILILKVCKVWLRWGGQTSERKLSNVFKYRNIHVSADLKMSFHSFYLFFGLESFQIWLLIWTVDCIFILCFISCVWYVLTFFHCMIWARDTVKAHPRRLFGQNCKARNLSPSSPFASSRNQTLVLSMFLSTCVTGTAVVFRRDLFMMCNGWLWRFYEIVFYLVVL